MVINMIFRKAILIVHGFAGGVYDEELLANYLETYSNFDVFTFTLTGHGKKVTKIKYENWIDCADKEIEKIIDFGYKNIYVIGHSMGGVIACHLADKYKEVKRVVLAAPAFEFLSFKDGNLEIGNSIKKLPNVIKSYHLRELVARGTKLPINATEEFIRLTKVYRNCPNGIKVPILIIQGLNDCLVPESSSYHVYNLVKSKYKKIIFVDGVDHDIFDNKRSMEICVIIKNFLKKKFLGKYSNTEKI